MYTTFTRCVLLVVTLFVHEANAAPVTVDSGCLAPKLRVLEEKMAAERGQPTPLTRPRNGPVSVFAVLPTTEPEYKAVYGPDVSYTAQLKRDFVTAAERVKSLDRRSIASDLAGKDRRAFESFVRRSEGRVAVIIGHNENGKFRFLSGEEMPIVEMAESCSGHDVFCVFLTCEAQGHLAGRPCTAGATCTLSVDEATRSLEYVAAHVASETSASAETIRTALERGVAARKRATQVRYLIAGGVVVGLIYVIYEST